MSTLAELELASFARSAAGHATAYDIGVLGPTPVGLILQLMRGPALLAVVVVLQLVLFG